MARSWASGPFVLAAACLAATAGAQVVPPPPPPPPPGPPCDLAACTCDGVDLKGLQAKGVVEIPPDAEGYSYKLSVCNEIPSASLPTGCQQYAEHPAIVKFKADNLADCIEVGSIGPCSQGSCGMSGVKTPAGVDVTYTYTYGCENTFTLSLTSGTAATPGAVTSNECSYTASWAALGPSACDQCIEGTLESWCPADNSCHKTFNPLSPCFTGSHAGDCVSTSSFSRCKCKSCTDPACLPPQQCPAALVQACAAEKSKGSSPCLVCCGEHASALHAAGCTQADFNSFYQAIIFARQMMFA